MSSQEALNVAIIGAGIGGLAAAIGLQRAGFHVDVYERASSLKELGAAVIIRPESVKVLKDWGLAEEYAQYRVPIPEMNVLKGATGQPMKMMGFQRDTGDVHSVHRADLHNHLRSKVPVESIHLSHKCKSISEHADYAEIQFADGSSKRASIVIAADGIHSTIRPVINKKKDVAIFSGLQGHRSVLPRERIADLLTHDIPCIWIKGRNAIFLLLPVRDGIAFDAILPMTEEAEESWTSTIDADELVKRLKDFDPVVHEIVRRTEGPISVFGLYDREPISTWNSERVALLGDAAHPMLPFEGQGANQAIQDAAALAECLRGVKAGGIGAALDRYSSIRIPATRKIQKQSRRRLLSPVLSMLLGVLSQLGYQLKTIVQPAKKGKRATIS